MNDLLRRILAGRMSWTRFALGAAGFVVGLLTVLLSVQTYSVFRSVLDPREDFHEYLILSKQVNLLGGILGKGATFDDDELEDLRAQPFVQRMATFGASEFSVYADVGGDLGIETELFLEAVPTEFLDVAPETFRWSEEKDPVPILLPQDFLDLYNFGYALSQSMPQLTEGTIFALPIVLTIQGPRERRVLDARVVGFSHRIGSILVPDEFLKWANTTIGPGETKPPSKIIVHVDQRHNAEIRRYLAERNLRVNPDRLNSGRAVMILNVATTIVLLVGIFFVVLAVTILVLNLAILVSDARDELDLLVRLGYTTRILFSYLFRSIVTFVAIITVASAAGFAICWMAIADVLVDRGLPVSTGLAPAVIPLGLAFVVATILVTSFYTRRLLVRL